jgi:outer membrane protein
MKQLRTIIVLFLLVVGSATAQTQKGSWLVGAQVADFSLQGSQQGGLQKFGLSLTPTIGYFPIENLVVGVGVPLSSTRYRYTDGNRVTLTGIGLSSFAQYYIGTGKLKPYVGISYSYVQQNQRYDLDGSFASRMSHYGTLSPTIGLAYFISKRVGININASYNILLTKDRRTNPVPLFVPINSYPITNNGGLSLGIGVQFAF